MKQFRIKENGFKEIRKQILIRTLPLFLIAMIAGLVCSELNPANKGTSDLLVFLIIIPVILVSLFIGIRIGLKRQKAIYNTYTLSFDDTGVTREQFNTTSIRLSFNEITIIKRNKTGGLVITGKNKSDLIIIPAQIDDMVMVESILKENCSIQIGTSKTIYQQLMIPLVVIVVGLMVITYASTNKILVSVCGTILTATMIWSFIKTQTNKNIDKKTKRSSYSVLIVILVIIGIMISKLMK